MSKKETQFNVGDKFILTISEKYAPAGTDSPCEDSPKTLYRIKGFNSLVFDAAGLRKLKRYEPPKPIDIEAIRDDAFYNGAREAWELAAHITSMPSDGGMTNMEFNEVFGYDTDFDSVFRDYSFTEAKDKVDAYFAKKKAEEEKARLEAIQSEGSQTDGDDTLKPGDIVRNVATGALAVVASEPNGGGVVVVERGGLFHACTFGYKKVGKNALEALGVNGVKSDA